MQDRIRPLDEVLLQRTAGPYIGSGADIARHQANVALPPKADKLQTFRDVRLVPKADICAAGKMTAYSITSSASASTPGGIVRASALAVLRLITNSNLVGCTTGSWAGFSPLKMRSTYDAAPRHWSSTSAP